MNFFKVNRARKELKEVIHYAKHVRHMHEDIADPEKIELMHDLEKAAHKIRRGSDVQKMEMAGDALGKSCERLIPPKRHAKIRENVEVIFVAIAAAMAIRAYFFQPFKIPTGSMQPTLYGITVPAKPTIPGNSLPARIADLIFCGERHVVIRAKTSGFLKLHTDNYGTMLDLQTTKSQSKAIIFINNIPYKIPMNLWHAQGKAFWELAKKKKDYFHKGDILFDGIVKSGDYILVNRIKYNFVRPKRGDIVVFDTRELKHPQVRTNAYYIKRLVGLPDETISLAPPYLLVNGKKPADPRFEKLFTHENYKGYLFGDARLAPLLGKSSDSIKLSDDQFLFFGDNTEYSLDGRYFGPVNRERVLGPAFFVCWPLDRAGFAEISH